MDVNAWLKMTWHDYSLEWDPKQYEGVADLRFKCVSNLQEMENIVASIFITYLFVFFYSLRRKFPQYKGNTLERDITWHNSLKALEWRKKLNLFNKC